MMKQENKFNFHPMIELGIFSSFMENIDLNYWIELCYKVKESPNTSVVRSNRGGWQSESDLHYNPDFYPLVKEIKDFIYPVFNNPHEKITSLWANISPSMGYNNPHTHTSGDAYPYKEYSGVIYLKTPSNCGRICFKNLLNTNDVREVIPQEKMIIIFPAVLEHYVEPNLSNEDRISIAFNYE